MKKNLFKVAAAALLLLAFNSCGNSNLDLDKTLKFSTKTVEEQKQSIEQSAIDFVDKMDGIQDTKAMVAMQSMSGNMAMVAPMKALRTNLINRNSKSLEIFDKQMRVAAATGEDMWGEYTYNFTTGEMDFTSELTNKTIIHFPATENSTTNNGLLTVTFADSNVKMPDSNPVQYMPSSITVVLKVDGSTALKADFSASYNSDATPTKAKQTLEIEKYNWSAEYSNNEKVASASYAFKYGSETMLKLEMGAEGTTTMDAVNNSDGPQDILTSGAVYFQLMNVAFLGGMTDVEGFAAEINALGDYKDPRAEADAQVAVINTYLKLYVYFVKEKQKFAFL